MNLEQTKEILKKVSLILLGLSSLGLLAFLFLVPKAGPQESKPSAPQVTQLPEIEKPSPPSLTPPAKISLPKVEIIDTEKPEWRETNTKVTFNLAEEKIPEELVVYKKISENTKLTEEKAREIAKSLGFDGLPRENNDSEGITWVWLKGAKSLRIIFESKFVEFGWDSFADPTILEKGKKVSETKAKETAANFLAVKGLANPYLDLANPQISYSGTEFSEDVPRETESPEIAILKYSFKIEGKELLLNNPSTNYTTIAITSKNEVISFKTNLYDASWEEFENFKLISLNQAKQTMQSGGGIMVENNHRGSTNETLSSFEIDQVSLSYYGQNNKEKYLQPVYAFEGNGVLVDGNDSQVIVYVPAVDY